MGKYFHYLLLLALLLHCLPAEATTYFCIRDHGPWLLFTGLDYWPTFALAVTIDFVALAKSFRGVRQQFVRFLGVVAGNLIVWLSYFLLFFYLDNRLNLKWLESNTFGAWFSLMSILVFCTWIVKFCSYSVLNWMHCEIEERFLGHSLAMGLTGTAISTAAAFRRMKQRTCYVPFFSRSLQDWLFTAFATANNQPIPSAVRLLEGGFSCLDTRFDYE